MSRIDKSDDKMINQDDSNIEKELAELVELIENGVVTVDRYCERMKSMFLSTSCSN